MLILTRQLQEAIMIGDNVTVTVLAVNGNQVRLGIDAPRELAVHREEIYDRIHNGAKESAVPPVPVKSRDEADLQELDDRREKAPVILTRKRRTW